MSTEGHSFVYVTPRRGLFHVDPSFTPLWPRVREQNGGLGGVTLQTRGIAPTEKEKLEGVNTGETRPGHLPIQDFKMEPLAHHCLKAKHENRTW